MISPRIRIIANPASGRGRGGRALPAVRAAFAHHGISDVQLTAVAGDEAVLARRAIDEGIETLVALGGDGTWSKVGRAIVESGSDCRLALLSAGTGNDLAKSIGTPAADFAATAELVAEGTGRRIDVGAVDGVPFLNIAGFGFDAAVLEHMMGVRRLSGNALYAWSALSQLFGYRGFDAQLEQDGTLEPKMRFLGLFFANGQRFGGSFQIAPNARLDDGRLDLVALGAMSSLRRARLFAAATQGHHLGAVEVSSRTVTRMRLRFASPPLYDGDGDLYRAVSSEVVVSCLPAALRIIAPG